MNGISAPHAPSKISNTPLPTPRVRGTRIIAVMRNHSFEHIPGDYAFATTRGYGSHARICNRFPPGDRAAVPSKVTSVDSRRLVPRTDALLADPRLAAAARRLGRARVKAAVTAAQQRAREGRITPAQVADVAVAALPAHAASLTPVLNATGVLLHTNLGRAPLSAAARDAVADAAGCT